jgi:hypothetical protein
MSHVFNGFIDVSSKLGALALFFARLLSGSHPGPWVVARGGPAACVKHASLARKTWGSAQTVRVEAEAWCLQRPCVSPWRDASRRPSSSPSILSPVPPPASPACTPPLFPCRDAPFSPTPVKHSVPAAHARLASWPRRRCTWGTAGERARWRCPPAVVRDYRPPWPSGDG